MEVVATGVAADATTLADDKFTLNVGLEAAMVDATAEETEVLNARFANASGFSTAFLAAKELMRSVTERRDQQGGETKKKCENFAVTRVHIERRKK